MKRVSIRRTLEMSFSKRMWTSGMMNFTSRATSNCDSSSLQEPIENQQRREKSALEPRPAPSAMFEGIEITDFSIELMRLLPHVQLSVVLHRRSPFQRAYAAANSVLRVFFRFLFRFL